MKISRSRECWKRLHEYSSLNYSSWTPESAYLWLESWLNTVPNYGCPCRNRFKQYMQEHPPTFSTPEKFFEWTIDAHNHVSTKHVIPPKSTMTQSEAATFYKVYWLRENSHPKIQ